jgi:hypothetical protein
MTYAIIEDELATLLATIDGLDAENITKTDFSILNRGWSQAVILEYGGIKAAPFTGAGTTNRIWTINIYLLVQYINDIQVHEDLNLLREAVMDKVQGWPRLDGVTVFDAMIVAGRPLPPDIDDENGINFFWESLECEAEERKVIAFND